MKSELAAFLALIVAVITSHSISRTWSHIRSTDGTPAGLYFTETQVTLMNPKSGGRIDCSRDSQGLYRCPVNGTSQGVAGTQLQLLLWVKPIQPSGDGWYLQRGNINGIHRIEKNGDWKGVAQIGNLEFPPHDRDVVEIEVTVVQPSEANTLLGQKGASALGDPVGTDSDLAEKVRVHLR